MLQPASLCHAFNVRLFASQVPFTKCVSPYSSVRMYLLRPFPLHTPPGFKMKLSQYKLSLLISKVTSVFNGDD